MQTVKLGLPLDKVQVVMNALSQLPWITANPVISEIDQQVKPQVNAQPQGGVTEQAAQ
ncbi:hypothetical protein IFT48_13385 [Pseudomonas fluorescens]|uniref:hypothetical protein n=1 Tax=Pseudomonas fluorescens TaxID=294 RepID=UPI0019052846|nr:hypothetical protein [Pseudomonas fluorescens]MBD8090989.1 hypothetical protein [Pseudomonas fluorescens]MBD8717479.1 hypothetical protein [Pseudomonas fluorescens]